MSVMQGASKKSEKETNKLKTMKSMKSLNSLKRMKSMKSMRNSHKKADDSHFGADRRSVQRTSLKNGQMKVEDYEEAFNVNPSFDRKSFFKDLATKKTLETNPAADGAINPLKFGIRHLDTETEKLRNIENEKLKGMTDFTQSKDDTVSPVHHQNGELSGRDKAGNQEDEEDGFEKQGKGYSKELGPSFRYFKEKMEATRSKRLRYQPANRHAKFVLFPDDPAVLLWMILRMMYLLLEVF